MAIYPTGVKTFTTKNPGEIIQAGHINDLQDEVAAIEAALIAGSAPSNPLILAAGLTGGSVDNWAPAGFTRSTVFNFSLSSDLILTGLVPPAGPAANGTRVTFHNFGPSTLYLPHATASPSTGTNVFSNVVTSGYTPVGAGGWATYVFVAGSGWLMVDHEQGAPINMPITLGAAGGGSASISSNNGTRFYVSGRMLTISFYWVVTVTGAVNTITLLLPANLSGISTGFSAGPFTLDAVVGLLQATPSGTVLNMYANPSLAPYAAGNHSMAASFAFAVN